MGQNTGGQSWPLPGPCAPLNIDADGEPLLAIPEEMVLSEPDVIRSTVSLWRIYGWHVVCVTFHHHAAVHAVLGDRVEYVTSDAWLDSAVWVARRPG